MIINRIYEHQNLLSL